MKALRTILIDHLANNQPLLTDLAIGGTTVFVPNTNRFRVNDEILLSSIPSNMAERMWIVSIPEYNQLVISTEDPTTNPTPVGSTRAWTVAESTHIQKAVGHQMLKGVYIGDLKQLPDFPCITISPADETNEWMTLLGTTHEYKIRIRIYVLGDNFETSEELLSNLALQTREILIDHIHPIVDARSFPLVDDLPAGGTVVNISSGSSAYFAPGNYVYLRDAKMRPFLSQENGIRSILAPSVTYDSLELSCASENDFLVNRQAELLLINRYLYDTRPDSISYGYVPGQNGSFMRAAEISYFAKEMICRDGNILT